MTQRTRRVVVVLDYGDIRGGLEKVAIDSALALRASGKQVHLFCGVGPVDPRLAEAGVEVTCLGLSDIASDASRLNAMKTGVWNAAAARALDRAIRDTDDLPGTVVHVHGWTKSLSSAIGPVVTAPDLRHVFTMHEYFLACPNGGFYDYQRNEICHRQAMGVSCLLTNCDVRHASHKAYRVLRQAVQRGRGHLPGRVRNVIYISELQKRMMQPYLPTQCALFRVDNPIALSKAPRIVAEANAPVAMLGRMAPSKGVVEFAQAARAAGLPALFIGDGELRAAALAANPEAEVTGWLSAEAAIARLSEARALALPSRWAEPFGLVAMEALGRGLPVVAGSWGAARELVSDGETGLLFDRLEPQDDFVAALKRLHDPDYVRKMSEAAYDRYWADPLTMERHLARLLEVYEQV